MYKLHSFLNRRFQCGHSFSGQHDTVTSDSENQFKLRGEERFSEFSDGDKQEPEGAVFSALDAMLKGSLDRLKSMRSVGSISPLFSCL